MRPVKGKFISLEGGEGTGKSTQMQLLADRMNAAGIDVITTREPGGTSGAEDIRALLVEGEPGRWGGRTEALLVNAGRADHVARKIVPALDSGKWVVCDRYIHSTLAYQGAARGLDETDLLALHRFATGDLWPDFTIIFDVDPLVGLQRAATRQMGEARFEGETSAFHAAVRKRMLAFTADERCAIVDASSAADAVAEKVWALITSRFAL